MERGAMRASSSLAAPWATPTNAEMEASIRESNDLDTDYVLVYYIIGLVILFIYIVDLTF